MRTRTLNPSVQRYLLPQSNQSIVSREEALVTIEDFGGWQKVQSEHFADGGIFDQIYSA